MLETGKQPDTKIHALYCDIAAAYDSVSTQSKTLSYWTAGMPTSFCQLMAALDKGYTAQVITPQGSLTERFPMLCGLRQGDTISPLGWQLFTDPLIKWIRKGVKCPRPITYQPTAQQASINGSHTRNDTEPTVGVPLKHTKHSQSCVLFMDDDASASLDRRDFITIVERKSRFLNLHHLNLPVAKTQYTTNTDAVAPGVLTDNIWTRVSQIECTTPVRYLGILCTLTLNWTPQIKAISRQLRTSLALLHRKRASLKETTYMINSVIIPSILFRLKYVSGAYTTARDLDSIIVKSLRKSARIASGASYWSWYASHEMGGMGMPRVLNYLLREHVKLVILALSAPATFHTHQAILSMLALHMRTHGVTQSPLFLPPQDRPPPRYQTSTQTWIGTVYQGLHTHGIVLTTRAIPSLNTPLPYQLLPDKPLATVLTPRYWEGLSEYCTANSILNTSDIAAADGSHIMPWSQLRDHLNTKAAKPHWQYTELISHITESDNPTRLKFPTSPLSVKHNHHNTPLKGRTISPITPMPTHIPDEYLPLHTNIAPVLTDMQTGQTIHLYSDGSVMPKENGEEGVDMGFATQLTEGPEGFIPAELKDRSGKGSQWVSVAQSPTATQQNSLD